MVAPKKNFCDYDINHIHITKGHIMFTKATKTFTFALIIGASMPAHSYLPLKEYDKLKDTGFFKAYMHGVGVSIQMMNGKLAATGNTRIICAPSKLEFDAKLSLQTMEAELAKHEYPSNWPLEMVMINGFIETFPCEEKDKVK